MSGVTVSAYAERVAEHPQGGGMSQIFVLDSAAETRDSACVFQLYIYSGLRRANYPICIFPGLALG